MQLALREWSGPIALALYSSAVSSGWQALYVRKKLEQLAGISPESRALSSVLLVTPSRADVQIGYPINMLRNTAAQQVATDFFLVLDADFAVSPDFQAVFQAALSAARLARLDVLRTVFIAPAFEFTDASFLTEKMRMLPFPASKAELFGHVSLPIQLVCYDKPRSMYKANARG